MTHGTSASLSFTVDLGTERRYPITCCECGKRGEQVGKELPRGWHWAYGGLVLRHYCESVICWDRSWRRLREDWCSA
jgi:hypothetical protein